MLKITTFKEDRMIRLVLEGKLASASIKVLENCWHEARPLAPEILVEFADISFVDHQAKELLKRMAIDGVLFFARDIQMKAIIEEIRRKEI